MALFKILKGNEANLPSDKHEGWAYVTEKGNMYVDLSNDTRVKVGNRADTAEFADKATGDTKSIRDLYLAKIAQVESTGSKFTFRGITGGGDNAPDLISIPLAGDLAGLISNVAQTIKGTKTFADGISFPTIATWPTVSGETYPIQSKGLGWSGSSDNAKIYYEVQGSDKGMLIIESGDDTDAGATFRNASSKNEVIIRNGLVTGAFAGNLTGTASHATADGNGNNIAATYVADVSKKKNSDGSIASHYVFRVTKGDGTYKDVDLHFAASASCGGAANSANILNGHSEKSVTGRGGDGKLRYTYNVSNGTVGLFNVSNNANAIITVNKHAGNYDSQLGFSSNGNIYYRNFNGGALDTTTTWKQIAFTDGTIENANVAEKDTASNIIAETYIKHPLTISEETITMTRGDGEVATITIPDKKVTQSNTNASNYRPVVLGATHTATVADLTKTVRDQVYVSTKFYASPSKGIFVAPEFQGKLTGKADTAGTADYAVADEDGNNISATYVADVSKKKDDDGKISSHYIFTVTKGDGTTNDVDLYFAASGSCGGAANSANTVNVIDIRGANHLPNDAIYKDKNMQFIFNNNTMPSSDWYSGMHVAGWTRTDYQSWELVSGSSTGLNGKLYYRNGKGGSWNGWKELVFTDGTVENAQYAEKDKGGNIITDTYIATLVQETSNGTTFAFKGVSGGGDDRPSLITIPAASTSLAGLVTNAAQTIGGTKTFASDVYSNGTFISTRGANATGGGFLLRGNTTDQARIYIATAGTTSAIGVSQFTLGNNVASGTAYNSRGRMYIYGRSTTVKMQLDADTYGNFYMYATDETKYYSNNSGTQAINYWHIYNSGHNLVFRTHATGTATAEGVWKYVMMFQNGGMALGSTNQSVTPAGGSATTMMLRAEGNGYFNGDVWSTAQFIANKSGTGQGFQILNNSVQYARMYVGTVGTAGDGTNTGTTGVAWLMLGNTTAVTNTSGSGANNARGAIRLHGSNANYTDIYAQANGNRNLYLPNYAGNMYLLHAGDNKAVGSGTQPVYIAANGRVTTTTYALHATVNAGSANRLPYYSGANAISQTSHYANTTQIGINITNTDTIGSYNLYVEGNSCVNGGINPGTTNAFSLGTSSLKWNTAYINTVYGNVTGYATYLPCRYDGGDKPNPQQYFGSTIGLRVAMTRNAALTNDTSAWHDTLWINGYSGSDVKNMVAISTIRNGTPRMFLSAQQNTATTYGKYYEVMTAYNIPFVYSADIDYIPGANKFKLTRGSTGWSSHVYSKDGYYEGVSVSYTIDQTTAYIMVGLNADPATDANYPSIDYCWYTQSGGALSIYENGSSITSLSGHTTYAVGDVLKIEYSGGYVHYYHNGVLCRRVYRYRNASKLYFDSSFYSTGSISNVKVTPITTHALNYYYKNTDIPNWDTVNTSSFLATVGATGGAPTTATKPSGADNAYGVLHLNLHSGNYAMQLGFNGTKGHLFLRNAYNSATFGAWAEIVDSVNYPNILDGRYVNAAGDSMTGTLRLGAPYQATAASRYTSAPLEIREAGRVGSAQSDIGYAPRIGFHWSGRIAASLVFHSDGAFYFRNQADTGQAPVYASTFYGALSGNATSATYVKDRSTGTATYLNYGAAGLTSTSWYAAWNGYELRAISPANLATHLATSTLDERYVNVTGDTMSGALTFAANDSYGIFPATTNWCSIGSSSYRFYRSYINNMYASSISTSSLTASSSVTALSIISNTTASGSGGLMLRANQTQYARLYVNTIGAASTTEGTNGTLGEVSFMIGNATAQSATLGEGAHNARGNIYLYGTTTYYTRIYTNNIKGNYSFVLPNYGGTQYAVHAGTTSAVGATGRPVYVAANGRVTACSWAANTDKIFVTGVANNTSPLTVNGTVYMQGTVLYGAAWNDYAEYRQTNVKVEPGRIVVETGKGDLQVSTKRLQPGANVVSDTFGFAIGETECAKTPLAVAGRALVYPFEDKSIYQAGDAVCSAPNGTVSKMTREEILMYPERIVGTVSEIPDYDIWNGGDGQIQVNGRIWIKVK